MMYMKNFLLACVMIAVLLNYSFVDARQRKSKPLSPKAKKIHIEYLKRLEILKNSLKNDFSFADLTCKENFIKYHHAVSVITPRPKPKAKPGVRMIVHPTFVTFWPPYAEAQKAALNAARKTFESVDKYLQSNKNHEMLAEVALLRDGSKQMAKYASLGESQKADVDFLLNQPKLIVQVMEMGGAILGKYGQAMQMYQKILKASETIREDNFFKTWALAIALENPDGITPFDDKTPQEYLVEVFLNYEEACYKGELDPSFKSIPGWDSRFIIEKGRNLKDTVWMRKVLRNYRPDHTRLVHRWRYCRITKSDIPYTGGISGSYNEMAPDLGLSIFQKFFLEGGICGPRAFVGRTATRASGIPALAAPQTGHAAMARWTPEGWVTVFGAHWSYNRCKGNGLNFELQSRARRRPELYRQVLRSQWIGDVFDERDTELTKFGCGGGFWKALAHYKKLAICEDEELKEPKPVGSEFAESNVPTPSPVTGWEESDNSEEKVSRIPPIKISEVDKTITTDDRGVITIPVAASKKPVSTEKVRYMRSFDNSFVQVHFNLQGIRPELLEYTVTLPKAGKYYFSTRVVSVTLDRTFLLRVNRRSLYDVKIPFSMGDWVSVDPIALDLKKGKNRIMITMKASNKGLTIRDLTLTPVSNI